MTALKEQLFAEAFSELVARATSEPFISLGAIGRVFAGSGSGQPATQVIDRATTQSDDDGRARRFAEIEASIRTMERAHRRVR